MAKHSRGCSSELWPVTTSSSSRQAVEALVGLYERHIAREETELLPMAARLLSDDDLDRVGRAMRERRGIVGNLRRAHLWRISERCHPLAHRVDQRNRPITARAVIVLPLSAARESRPA